MRDAGGLIGGSRGLPRLSGTELHPAPEKVVREAAESMTILASGVGPIVELVGPDHDLS